MYVYFKNFSEGEILLKRLERLGHSEVFCIVEEVQG